MKNAKKFKMVECQGTHYEIGQQWGEGCKDNILKVSENIFTSMKLYYQASKEEDTAAQLQPDSYHRLDRIRSLIDEHYGHINIDIIKNILVDHDKYPYSICRHLDDKVQVSSKTLASFIMIPEEGVIYIAAGNPCEYDYIKYEF